MKGSALGVGLMKAKKYIDMSFLSLQKFHIILWRFLVYHYQTVLSDDRVVVL
jgi:hypothetical protein